MPIGSELAPPGSSVTIWPEGLGWCPKGEPIVHHLAARATQRFIPRMLPGSGITPVLMHTGRNFVVSLHRRVPALRRRGMHATIIDGRRRHRRRPRRHRRGAQTKPIARDNSVKNVNSADGDGAKPAKHAATADTSNTATTAKPAGSAVNDREPRRRSSRRLSSRDDYFGTRVSRPRPRALHPTVVCAATRRYDLIVHFHGEGKHRKRTSSALDSTSLS